MAPDQLIYPVNREEKPLTGCTDSGSLFHEVRLCRALHSPFEVAQPAAGSLPFLLMELFRRENREINSERRIIDSDSSDSQLKRRKKHIHTSTAQT